MFEATGAGDDSLAKHVAWLDEFTMIAPPGTRASYRQAGDNLAGRVIETVTGLTYEDSPRMFASRASDCRSRAGSPAPRSAS